MSSSRPAACTAPRRSKRRNTKTRKPDGTAWPRRLRHEARACHPACKNVERLTYQGPFLRFCVLPPIHIHPQEVRRAADARVVVANQVLAPQRRGPRRDMASDSPARSRRSCLDLRLVLAGRRDDPGGGDQTRRVGLVAVPADAARGLGGRRARRRPAARSAPGCARAAVALDDVGRPGPARAPSRWPAPAGSGSCSATAAPARRPCTPSGSSSAARGWSFSALRFSRASGPTW